MDSASQALFGRFPRFVGNPRQFAVNSADEFDVFVDANDGSENVYASISSATKQGTAITDMVSLDFDSPLKEAAFEPGLRDDEKVARMRDDPELVDDVLGSVFEDVLEVGEWAIDQGVPGITVLTGFGIHVHLLYEPTVDASENLTSIAVRLKEELDLDTIDRLPIGDAQRLVRVPNCQRMAGGRACEIFCVPVRLSDIDLFDARSLFDLSTDRHRIDTDDIDGRREPMPLFEEYTSTKRNEHESESIHRQPIDSSPSEFDDGFLAGYLEDLLNMPCLWKRLLQPDPSHMVRFGATIGLLNCGLSSGEIVDLFGRLNWVDYDRNLTKQQVEHIYQKGYSAVSCETMMSRELCCYPVDDASDECPSHGQRGGLRNY
jgi:hypothetical protein